MRAFLWLAISAAVLPALQETDARAQTKPTYYPDYAVYHDVDRYNRSVTAAVHSGLDTCVYCVRTGDMRVGVLFLRGVLQRCAGTCSAVSDVSHCRRLWPLSIGR